MATEQYLHRHRLLGRGEGVEEGDGGMNILDIKRLKALPKLI